MPTDTSLPTRVVADIGGTNCRLALFDPTRGELRALRSYRNHEYSQLQDVIVHWLESLEETRPTDCCLAVAAPPSEDQVTMLNIDWSFSCRELAQRFGFKRLLRINDFESNALALPHLTAADLVTIHAAEHADLSGKLAVIGPGTGLGGSTLLHSGHQAFACACEPGHMGLAPATALELEIFKALQPQYGEIYAELLISGPGMRLLYQTLAAVMGQEAQPMTQEDISRRGSSGDCRLCEATLSTFCALLGSSCGDFVLANGAYGGLYLGGGILSGIIPFLQHSSFQQRFCEKGKMRQGLTAVPIHVITSSVTGLLGAAHAPL